MKNQNTISGNEPFHGETPENAEESLARARAAEAAEAAELAPAPEISAEPGPAAVVPNPVIVQTLGALVGKGLELSKAAGWSSPAAEPLFSEEQWQATVAQTAAVVIARHFPRLNDNVSEEFTLLVLVAPWLITNLVGMFWRRKHPAEKKTEEKKPDTPAAA